MVTRKRSTPQPVYTHLAITIDSFSIRIDAGINYELHDLRHAVSATKLYSHSTHIEVMGRCHYPEERADQEYRIDIFGRALRSGDFDKTLADVHVRDNDGHPKYRKRGDHHFPIYDPPDSVGFIDSARGSQLWTACAWVPPDSVIAMLAVLPHIAPLYITIQEVKFERRRKIRSITMQTSDPAEE